MTADHRSAEGQQGCKSLIASPQHCTMSSYREMLLEHLFVGEVLRHLWIRGIHAEVLKPQTDDAGYDLVIETNGITRHIQLKASHDQAATARVNVHVRLASKRSGCLIWIRFNEKTMALGPFLWLGNAPGQPLPCIEGLKVAKHTKGDSTGRKSNRVHLRQVPVSRFTKLKTIDEVVEVLFGLPSQKSPRPEQPGSKAASKQALCPCCEHNTPTHGPRICPICGHEFKGKAWEGIDAHWKAKHESIMPYSLFIKSLCRAHLGKGKV